MPKRIDRIEDDPKTWDLAERIFHLAMESGGTEKQVINGIFSALTAAMTIGNWTIDQAKYYLLNSVEQSFGTTGTMRAGAAEIAGAKRRS